MRILKILLSILILLAAIFFIGGFFIPDTWTVSRSTVIDAKPSHIYPFVSNFKEWEKWSPWNSSKDASLKYTYEGSESGMGSKQSWTSEKMGKGSMEFTKADPETGVAYDLNIDMGKMQSKLHGAIDFAPEGDQTKVTWTDQGDSGQNFVKRWMSVIFKPMLSKDMDTGLANLKALAEKKKAAE